MAFAALNFELLETQRDTGNPESAARLSEAGSKSVPKLHEDVTDLPVC
jgi:hypothetical protein